MLKWLSTRSEDRFNVFTDCNMIRISCKFAKYPDERANCSRVVCAMIASISVSWCTSCSQEVGQIEGFQVVPGNLSFIPLSRVPSSLYYKGSYCISLQWQAIIHSQVFSSRRENYSSKFVRKERKRKKKKRKEKEDLSRKKNWFWRKTLPCICQDFDYGAIQL